MHKFDPLAIVLAVATLFVAAAAGAAGPIDFAAAEPRGACETTDAPLYVVEGARQCSCAAGTWSCTAAAQALQSPATLYTVINDAGTYKAVDDGGTTVYASADPGLVLQQAIDDADDTGGQLLLRSGDTFTYTETIPRFRPNPTGWVTILGYGATIALSAGAPRAFDFGKQAHFDVFGRLRLEGLTVDAMQQATGTINHVLLGFHRAGVRARDVSVDGVIVRNVRILNIYADGNGPTRSLALNLSPQCTRGAIEEPSLRNIWISGVEIRGGEAGIAVTVSDRGTSGPYRCYVENVHIRDNTVALGDGGGTIAPTEFSPGTGIFVGGDVRFSANVHISGNYVQHAPDNCYEVSAPLSQVTFDRNVCVDPQHVGLTLNNFPSAGDPDGDGQYGEENLDLFGISVSNFTVRFTNTAPQPSPKHRGVTVNNTTNSASPFGFVRITNLSFLDSSGDPSSSSIHAINRWSHISVDGLRAYHFDVRYDELASPATPAHVVFQNHRAGGLLSLRDVQIRVDGEFDAAVKQAGGSISARLFQLTGEDLDIDLDGIRVDLNLRNFDDPGDRYAVFEIGHGSGALPSGHATVSGRIANISVFDETKTADDNPFLARLGSGLVVDDDLLFIDNISVLGMGDASNLLYFDDPALERRADRVYVSRMRPNHDAVLNPLPERRWDYVEVMDECVEFSNGTIGKFGRCSDYRTLREGTGDCRAANMGDAEVLSSRHAITACKLSTGLQGGVAGLNVLQTLPENTSTAGLHADKLRQFATRVRNNSAAGNDATFVAGGFRTTGAKDIGSITAGAYWTCSHGELTQNWLAVVETNNQRSVFDTGDDCFDGRFVELVIEFDETRKGYRFVKNGSVQVSFDCTTDNCPAGEELATWAAVLASGAANWSSFVDFIYYRGRR